ncbi:hypothetical protein ACHAWF_000538 [Thalassiosira exigua]
MKKPLSFAFGASWAIATVVCLWFLFVHAPPLLASRESIHPLFALHLVGAYAVYLACVNNTLLTPSTLGGSARPFHVWVGRVGLALGLVGFVSGFVLTWLILDFRSNLGFSMGITYGGFAQAYLEVVGFRAIKRYQEIKARIETGDYQTEAELLELKDEKDEKLRVHIWSMIPLFILACGIPALMRVCDKIGYIYLPLIIAAC